MNSVAIQYRHQSCIKPVLCIAIKMHLNSRQLRIQISTINFQAHDFCFPLFLNSLFVVFIFMKPLKLFIYTHTYMHTFYFCSDEISNRFVMRVKNVICFPHIVNFFWFSLKKNQNHKEEFIHKLKMFSNCDNILDFVWTIPLNTYDSHPYTEYWCARYFFLLYILDIYTFCGSVHACMMFFLL